MLGSPVDLKAKREFLRRLQLDGYRGCDRMVTPFLDRLQTQSSFTSAWSCSGHLEDLWYSKKTEQYLCTAYWVWMGESVEWVAYLHKRLSDAGFTPLLEFDPCAHPIGWEIGIRLYPAMTTRMYVKTLHPVNMEDYFLRWNHEMWLALSDWLGIGYKLYSREFQLPRDTSTLEYSLYQLPDPIKTSLIKPLELLVLIDSY